MSEIKILANELKFPEGPVVMPDGSVAFAEIAGRMIRKVALDGTLSVVPGTGVEVLETEERDGIKYHVMRDLRNGNVVKM